MTFPISREFPSLDQAPWAARDRLRKVLRSLGTPRAEGHIDAAAAAKLARERAWGADEFLLRVLQTGDLAPDPRQIENGKTLLATYKADHPEATWSWQDLIDQGWVAYRAQESGHK